MIVFLPHQGGFNRKMTPANHMETLNREQRPNGAGVNSVNTDEYITFYNQLFRDGMMIEGDMDDTGVQTFEYNEDKWKILYRVLGPLYFPDDPEWVPEVHPRYCQYLWQHTTDEYDADHDIGKDSTEVSIPSKPVHRHPLTGKILSTSTGSEDDASSQQDEFEPTDDASGTQQAELRRGNTKTPRNSTVKMGINRLSITVTSL